MDYWVQSKKVFLVWLKGLLITTLHKRILLVFEWTLLTGGLGLLTLNDGYSPIILLALALLVISFLTRWLRTGHFLTRTGAELPLAVFLASAGLSTWAAYDRQLALLQLIRFIGTAVAFYAVVDGGSTLRRFVTFGIALAMAILAVYFVIHNDFNAYTSKFAPLTAIGLWLNTHLPAVPGPTVHPNVAGGALILGIPLSFALAVDNWKQKHLVRALLVGLLVMIAIFGLLMTSSRGAWLGLAGALGLGLLVWFQRHWLAKEKAAQIYWLALAAILIISTGVLVQTGRVDRLLGSVPDPTGSLQSRLHLWQQGTLLARDYPFTGIGLQSFPMVFSGYTILIHVPYLTHAHNTYLEVLIEQGWPGFVAMLGFGLAGLWWTWNLLRRSEVSLMAWGGLAALTAVSLHGVVDVSLYLERTLPLVGVVAGLLAGEYLALAPRPVRIKKRFPLFALLILLAGGVIFWRPLASAAQANLGAVIQTSLELRAYDPNHFDQPTLDEVRRNIDLAGAETSFQAALALAPDLTALQRLSEIALSRGQYGDALAWMQSAWRNGARDEVTRLVYGDALVANGQPDAAVDIIQGLNWASGRLAGQAFYRYGRLGDYQREVDAWKAVVLLNPDDAQAAQNLQNALNQMKQK